MDHIQRNVWRGVLSNCGKWISGRLCNGTTVVLCMTMLLMLPPSRALAQGGEDLRAKLQNPIGSLISLPFENTLDFGAPDGTAYFLSIQPVIPFTVGNWNLINRVIAPLISAPGGIVVPPAIPEGVQGSRVFGLGDINYSLFLSPASPGKVIWGVGPSLTLPTATDNQLGSRKWSAGPAVVVLTQPPPWSLGVLVGNLWSFAGDPDRRDVNQFILQPFVNYNLAQGWYLTTDPVITANWNADDRWTVPLGGGVGKQFTIGKQPVNVKLQVYNNVVRPDNAPDWALKFTLQLVFPK